MLPILVTQARHLTAARARSAEPRAPVVRHEARAGSAAPVRPEAASPAVARRSPGAPRRAAAAALRRSADRLAPHAE